MDDLDLQSRSQLYKKKKVAHFPANLSTDWDKFSMLPQPVGLLKLMLNLFCTSNIQGRELCQHDFVKYTFNFVMCQDTCERIVS